MNYSGLRAVVTGGLGFIGSNLAIRLVDLGATVTILDSAVGGCGANTHNIEPVKDRVTVIEADIADTGAFRRELSRANVIFNLAGEISHIHSMQFPERDLQINTVSQLRFLLACAEAARGVRIVYASTRQVYGTPLYLPVDETHPIQPVDFNGVHKFAATSYHLMLTRTGALDCMVLCLTNVYGPRMALDVVCQGFLGTFMRRAVLGQQIEVFGDGQQTRDPVYVDDAVDAFLLAGGAVTPAHRCLNVGGPETLSVDAIAELASAAGGCPAPTRRPFPPDRKPIDIGSYRGDNRLMEQALDWRPKTSFATGLANTIEYYREHRNWYLDPRGADPVCRMPEHDGSPRRLTYVRVADA